MKPTKEYTRRSKIRIFKAENLDVLKGVPNNTYHSIVTDPPYGINFMGKKWDYDVPEVSTWEECLRVLKPGGHLLSFAGTKTQHRMAVNIEDAGFEIRDMIAWVYGSGFPKSHNIGKAVDEQQGNDREVTGQQRANIGMSGGNYNNLSKNGQVEVTKGNSEWEGWGTALKPAFEPITVARKPLTGTVAENVLEHGAGGLNIEDCRIEVENGGPLRKVSPMRENVYYKGNALAGRKDGTLQSSKACGTTDRGRFPTNFIHDGSQEVLSEFPQTSSGFMKKDQKRSQGGGYHGGFPQDRIGDNDTIGDSGSAARFFYCAKASKSERDGVTHPTVKPVDLMQYLVRLVTPKGGTVLDPYGGSLTTALACWEFAFNIDIIEKDDEHFDESIQRLERYISQTQLF